MTNQPQKDQAKPLLFIDVNGVLFGFYDGRDQLRPGVVSFLAWCLENFECHWLSAWSNSAQHIGKNIYGEDVFNRITAVNYHAKMFNDSKALAAIDFAHGRRFLWIEDTLSTDEINILESAGLSESYIHVNANGRDELDHIKTILQQELARI